MQSDQDDRVKVGRRILGSESEIGRPPPVFRQADRLPLRGAKDEWGTSPVVHDALPYLQRSSSRTFAATALPSRRCCSPSKWMPSKGLETITFAVSRKAQPSSLATRS